MDGGQARTAGTDHGGGIDAGVACWGGDRADWIDLSTGINPVPYPVGDLPPEVWTALPDTGATERLLAAARRFWRVPDGAAILAAPGASALIARMPHLAGCGRAHVPGPTYNEHARAFRAAGGTAGPDDPSAPVHVYVHPNNPDGRLWPVSAMAGRPLTIIDESFCDASPDDSHIALTEAEGVVVLKSFGKFWGLAGLRLGFAVAHPRTLAPLDAAGMADMLGPWPVSGPALHIGARALSDHAWAAAARDRLARDAARLDALMLAHGAAVAGGTTLFRLYRVDDALAWQDRFGRSHVLSRVFPYSGEWLRLGLPGSAAAWARLEAAL
ncbi:MAG: pyridoxal phosphate-dependent class II aminotransferase [Paracoccaceae bacterium]|nr:MAG: pyridoxal phosphate-dependent class II aminotransferase [Paracoccaceae bacterium]